MMKLLKGLILECCFITFYTGSTLVASLPSRRNELPVADHHNTNLKRHITKRSSKYEIIEEAYPEFVPVHQTRTKQSETSRRIRVTRSGVNKGQRRNGKYGPKYRHHIHARKGVNWPRLGQISKAHTKPAPRKSHAAVRNNGDRLKKNGHVIQHPVALVHSQLHYRRPKRQVDKYPTGPVEGELPEELPLYRSSRDTEDVDVRHVRSVNITLTQHTLHREIDYLVSGIGSQVIMGAGLFTLILVVMVILLFVLRWNAEELQTTGRYLKCIERCRECRHPKQYRGPQQLRSPKRCAGQWLCVSCDCDKNNAQTYIKLDELGDSVTKGKYKVSMVNTANYSIDSDTATDNDDENVGYNDEDSTLKPATTIQRGLNSSLGVNDTSFNAVNDSSLIEPNVPPADYSSPKPQQASFREREDPQLPMASSTPKKMSDLFSLSASMSPPPLPPPGSNTTSPVHAASPDFKPIATEPKDNTPVAFARGIPSPRVQAQVDTDGTVSPSIAIAQINTDHNPSTLDKDDSFVALPPKKLFS